MQSLRRAELECPGSNLLWEGVEQSAVIGGTHVANFADWGVSVLSDVSVTACVAHRLRIRLPETTFSEQCEDLVTSYGVVMPRIQIKT